MWRLNKNWKGLRREVPWAQAPAVSEYHPRALPATTQPMEEPERPEAF